MYFKLKSHLDIRYRIIKSCSLFLFDLTNWNVEHKIVLKHTAICVCDVHLGLQHRQALVYVLQCCTAKGLQLI